MVSLKLPKLGKGSSKGKKKAVLVTATVSVAAVAVVVILYYMNPKFRDKINTLFKIGDISELGPIVDVADTVDFNIPQDTVPPNTHFVLTGEFKDKEGKPVRVKSALFYVIQNASGTSGPRQMLLQGSLGNNVNKFSKEVPTSGFPRGDDYTVTVSDHPLSLDEIAGMDISGASLGITDQIKFENEQMGFGAGNQEPPLEGMGGSSLNLGSFGQQEAQRRNTIVGVGGVT